MYIVVRGAAGDQYKMIDVSPTRDAKSSHRARGDNLTWPQSRLAEGDETCFVTDVKGGPKIQKS